MKNRFLFFLTLVLFAGLFLGFRPKDIPEPKCIIYEYGIYKSEEKGFQRSNDVPEGKSHFVTLDEILLKKTKTIPAILYTSFDFKFKIINLPKKSHLVNLRKEVQFPSFRDSTGKKFNGYKIDFLNQAHNGEINNIAGYYFESKEELVIGEWKFSIWHKSKLLCSIVFDVVDP